MKKTAVCTSCHIEMHVDDMIYYPAANRGGRNAYICPRCRDLQFGYHQTTATTKGKEKSEPWTSGAELETVGHTDRAQAEFLSYGFKPSSDSSLGAYGTEYETPKFNGFGSITHYTPRIQSLLRSGDIIIDDRCGCHLHIGYGDTITTNYQNICHKFRRELLTAAQNIMVNRQHETEYLFGRFFNGYADFCENVPESGHCARYAWCNFKSSHETVEFRINYFRSAKQYNTVVMLEKKIVKALLKHFNPADLRNMTGAEIHAAAEKTGRYIARAIDKALNEIDF